MPLTVADVLALPELKAGNPRIRSGGDALDAPVRWVHVSEQPEVASTLTGGELLLSTGMALLGADLDVEAFVGSLRAAGAAGLVVELAPGVRELPDPLVRAARASHLPLVELSRTVRFVAITEVVHARILAEQLARLQFSQRVHEVFAALSVGTADAGTVLERASALTGRAVVLEDLSHRAVAFAGVASTGADELLRDWTSRSRREPTSERAVGFEGWSTVAVGPTGHRWGRLVVPARIEDGATPDPEQVRLVLERAAETLTIVRLIDRDTRDLAQQAHRDLLGDLMRGPTGDESGLRARARALGVSLRGWFVPVVLAPGPDGGPEPLADRAGRALDTLRLSGFTGVLPSGLVGVVVTVGSEASAVAVVPRLVTALAEARPVIATADPSTTLTALSEALLEAEHVAEVAASLPPADPPRAYRNGDLGARGLLWWLRTDPRLQAFLENQLEPLVADGAPRAAEDLRLLRAYLEAGGSVTRLARDLHLSRAAGYARLERLQARLGRDLSDAETRLSLHLALLARDITR